MKQTLMYNESKSADKEAGQGKNTSLEKQMKSVGPTGVQQEGIQEDQGAKVEGRCAEPPNTTQQIRSGRNRTR